MHNTHHGFGVNLSGPDLSRRWRQLHAHPLNATAPGLDEIHSPDWPLPRDLRHGWELQSTPAVKVLQLTLTRRAAPSGPTNETETVAPGGGGEGGHTSGLTVTSPPASHTRDSTHPRSQHSSWGAHAEWTPWVIDVRGVPGLPTDEFLQRNMPEERRETRQSGLRRDHKLFLYILEQNQLTQTLNGTGDLPGIQLNCTHP